MDWGQAPALTDRPHMFLWTVGPPSLICRGVLNNPLTDLWSHSSSTFSFSLQWFQINSPPVNLTCMQACQRGHVNSTQRGSRGSSSNHCTTMLPELTLTPSITRYSVNKVYTKSQVPYLKTSGQRPASWAARLSSTSWGRSLTHCLNAYYQSYKGLMSAFQPTRRSIPLGL